MSDLFMESAVERLARNAAGGAGANRAMKLIAGLFVALVAGAQITSIFGINANGGSDASGTASLAIQDTGGAIFNVKAYGAVADGLLYGDGVATAGSPTFTSASASFSAAHDPGKWFEAIGIGPGGEAFSGCSGTAGTSTVTCTGGAWASTDFGRSIYIPGSNLWAKIGGVTSATTISLGGWVGDVWTPTLLTAGFSGGTVYTGFMTIRATIASVVNANTITLSTPALASAQGLVFVYGTPNQVAFQKCVDAAGQAGVGTCYVPGVYGSSCPTKATCGYVLDTTNQLTANTPSALKIRYSGVSLVGDPAQTNLFFNGAWAVYPGAGGSSPVVVRGAAICLGDSGGSYTLPAGASASVSNVTVANLHLYGMTDGLTYNYSFNGTTAPLLTTGDGWDITHKGIMMIPVAASSNIRILNVFIQDFKGENIYEGGTSLADLTIRDSTLKNSNASLLSVGPGKLLVDDTTFLLAGANCVENTVDGTQWSPDVLIKHTYSHDICRIAPNQGFSIVGSFNSAFNGGSVDIIDSVFDAVGVGPHVGGATAAIYTTAQAAGNYPPAHMHVIHNMFHDTLFAIYSNGQAQPTQDWLIDGNNWTVDNYPAQAFLSFPFPASDVVVQNNTGNLTANATALGNYPALVYQLNRFYYGAGSLAWSGMTARGNTWDFGSNTYLYEFDTSGGPGWAAVGNKAIAWINERCSNCNNVAAVNYGQQTITSGGTIYPLGPVVWLTGGTGAPSMTIDNTKEDDGAELEIRNQGVAVSLPASAQISQSVTLAAGASMKWRFSAGDGKWHVLWQ